MPEVLRSDRGVGTRIVSLGEPSFPEFLEEAELGGKGATLHRLLRRGLPVPPGFVVLASAFWEWRRQPGAAQKLWALAAELEGPEPPAPAHLAERRPELAAEAEALRAVVETGLARWRGALPAGFAVRSSATVEDGAAHSFAGVLESFLAVAPWDLPAAILLCWAAAYTRRFETYCRTGGLDPTDAEIAVVVQELVPARVSGVLHTHDPLTGARGPVIDAVRGLGTVLVGGLVQPDHYLRRPDGGWELRRGCQEWMDCATAGGIVRVERAPGLGPALTFREAEQLARLAARVERVLGPPQDIEWAFEDGRLRLLQARPITALPVSRRTWTRANFKEIYPELPSPMTASLLERIGSNWLVEQFAGYGFPVRHLAPSVRFLLGRPYLNQTLLDTLAGMAGFDRCRPAESVGGAPGAAGGGQVARCGAWDARRALRHALPLLRLLLAGFAAPLRARFVLAQVGRTTRHLLRTCSGDADERTLLTGAVAAFAALRPLDALAVEVLSILSLARAAAAALLEGYVVAPEGFLSAVTVSDDRNPTAAQAKHLHALAALAMQDPAVRDCLAAEGPPPRPEAFAGTAFGNALARFLQRYGHRAMHESDSAVPRLAEEPAPLLRALAAALAAPGLVAERDPRPDARAAWVELRRALPAWQQWLPLRQAVLALLAALLRHFSALREQVRDGVARLTSARRCLELELGRRWAARGWLEVPEHYFQLRVEEAYRAVEYPGAAAEGWLRARVVRRQEIQRRQAELRAPDAWTEGPTPPPAVPEEPIPPGDGLELTALPISGGTAEGPVVVLSSPEEIEAAPAGTIVVIPTAGPTWLPLFLKARALIIEMGGTLSHAAIMAREYGVPAVANLPHATRRFRNGEWVRLDGTRGAIRRLPRSEPEPLTPAREHEPQR